MYQHESLSIQKTEIEEDFFEIKINTLALIARDWINEKKKGVSKFIDSNMGFAPHFEQIAKICSQKDCDMLLFSLWSHDEKKVGPIKKSQLFPKETKHKHVVLEINGNHQPRIEVWHRDYPSPVKRVQYFGSSSEGKEKKEKFIENFSSRCFGPTLLMFCGETNIIKTKRDSEDIIDEFSVFENIRKHKIKVILNPIHDYMRRPEMIKKRLALSKDKRYCISVWNRVNKRGGESSNPWTAFYDGENITDKIEEIDNPIDDQPGVRIGIMKGLKK